MSGEHSTWMCCPTVVFFSGRKNLWLLLFLSASTLCKTPFWRRTRTSTMLVQHDREHQTDFVVILQYLFLFWHNNKQCRHAFLFGIPQGKCIHGAFRYFIVTITAIFGTYHGKGVLVQQHWQHQKHHHTQGAVTTTHHNTNSTASERGIKVVTSELIAFNVNTTVVHVGGTGGLVAILRKTQDAKVEIRTIEGECVSVWVYVCLWVRKKKNKLSTFTRQYDHSSFIVS